jgi:hypothetical protein
MLDFMERRTDGHSEFVSDLDEIAREGARRMPRPTRKRAGISIRLLSAKSPNSPEGRRSVPMLLDTTRRHHVPSAFPRPAADFVPGPTGAARRPRRPLPLESPPAGGSGPPVDRIPFYRAWWKPSFDARSSCGESAED